MCLCSHVCSQWRDLINGCKVLSQKRNSPNPYEEISLIRKFGLENSQGQGFNAGGICTILDRVVVTDWSNHHAHVLNYSGNIIHTFGFKGKGIDQFKTPLGLCTLGESLLICDRINERIQVFDSTTFTPVQSIYLDGLVPLAICSTFDRLAVISTNVGVILVDRDGHIVRKFSSPKENGGMSFPFGICCNSRNEIMVSENYNNRVQIFSLDGLFLNMLGSGGKHPIQLQKPTGICVDACDNIYIAERKGDRISVFANGTAQQIFFSKPFALCLMDRRVIATSDQQFVGIFAN